MALFEGKERACEQAPVLVVDEGVGVDEVDDSPDPCTLFAELQEIAQGESGSVYSACVTPTIASQFRPLTLTSPAFENFPKEDNEEDEGLVQSKQVLVAIKCIPLLRGRTEKLVDLW
jgi:serine/threonine-protein kinase CLA4